MKKVITKNISITLFLLLLPARIINAQDAPPIPNIANAPTINQMGTLNKAATINQKKGVFGDSAPKAVHHSAREIAAAFAAREVRPEEKSGSTNVRDESAILVTWEEALRMAAEMEKARAVGTPNLAAAAIQAVADAQKAKTANQGKTEVVVLQDHSGHLVYMRRPKKLTSDR